MATKTYKVAARFNNAGPYPTGATFTDDEVGEFNAAGRPTKPVHPDHLAHWLAIGAVAEETADERAAREAAAPPSGPEGAEAKARATKRALPPDSPALTTGSPGGAPLDTPAAQTPGPSGAGA